MRRRHDKQTMAAKIKSKILKYFSPSPKQSENLNIYDIFKPVYYILTSIGMFPCSITYDKSKSTFKAVEKSTYKNVLCMITNLMIIYAFYVAHIEHLYSESDASSFTDAFMTEINYILEVSALIMYCTVAYISALLYRHKYIKILQAIASIWIDRKTESRNKIFGDLRFQVNVVVLGSLTFLCFLQILVNSTRPDSIWKIVLVTFSGVYPQMIQMITLAYHYVLVLFVMEILSDLNQQLLDLNNPKKPVDDLFFYNKQENKALRQVELVYMKAFEIKKDLNDAFEAPILMSTIQCFHGIVSESYILYHGVVARSHSAHVIANCIIWILYHIIKTYTLSHSGEMLKNQAVKVGETLHNIPIENMNIRTIMEVQHFASTMNHQNFVLTVYQFFPLDATLMSKMVTTVSMYLTMLVQYDNSDRGRSKLTQ